MDSTSSSAQSGASEIAKEQPQKRTVLMPITGYVKIALPDDYNQPFNNALSNPTLGTEVLSVNFSIPWDVKETHPSPQECYWFRAPAIKTNQGYIQEQYQNDTSPRWSGRIHRVPRPKTVNHSLATIQEILQRKRKAREILSEEQLADLQQGASPVRLRISEDFEDEKMRPAKRFKICEPGKPRSDYRNVVPRSKEWRSKQRPTPAAYLAENLKIWHPSTNFHVSSVSSWSTFTNIPTNINIAVERTAGNDVGWASIVEPPSRRSLCSLENATNEGVEDAEDWYDPAPELEEFEYLDRVGESPLRGHILTGYLSRKCGRGHVLKGYLSRKRRRRDEEEDWIDQEGEEAVKDSSLHPSPRKKIRGLNASQLLTDVHSMKPTSVMYDSNLYRVHTLDLMLFGSAQVGPQQLDADEEMASYIADYGVTKYVLPYLSNKAQFPRSYNIEHMSDYGLRSLLNAMCDDILQGSDTGADDATDNLTDYFAGPCADFTNERLIELIYTLRERHENDGIDRFCWSRVKDPETGVWHNTNAPVGKAVLERYVEDLEDNGLELCDNKDPNAKSVVRWENYVNEGTDDLSMWCEELLPDSDDSDDSDNV